MVATEEAPSRCVETLRWIDHAGPHLMFNNNLTLHIEQGIRSIPVDCTFSPPKRKSRRTYDTLSESCKKERKDGRAAEHLTASPSSDAIIPVPISSCSEYLSMDEALCALLWLLRAGSDGGRVLANTIASFLLTLDMSHFFQRSQTHLLPMINVSHKTVEAVRSFATDIVVRGKELSVGGVLPVQRPQTGDACGKPAATSSCSGVAIRGVGAVLGAMATAHSRRGRATMSGATGNRIFTSSLVRYQGIILSE